LFYKKVGLSGKHRCLRKPALIANAYTRTSGFRRMKERPRRRRSKAKREIEGEE